MRLFIAFMAAAALSGCSMTTEWFVQKSLKDAGFTRAQARCAVGGIAGQLSTEELQTLRGPLVRYVMLDDPPTAMDLDRFLEWLAPQVAPQTHRVVSHYATACRTLQ